MCFIWKNVTKTANKVVKKLKLMTKLLALEEPQKILAEFTGCFVNQTLHSLSEKSFAQVITLY